VAVQLSSVIPDPTPKMLISVSVAFLFLAAIFGALNSTKIRQLHSAVTQATTDRDNAERRRVLQEKELKAREAAVSSENSQSGERENKAAGLEAQLAQITTEKTQLQTQLQDKESELITLQKQLEQKQPSSVNPGAASQVELQAQLDDSRQQLDAAEREKTLMSDKLQNLQERSSQLENEKKRRTVAKEKVGVRGTVLAVNRAYNFVVLNLGGRQGVEPHTEMLVLRDGAFIGKIRISSVEPATAIGDIIIGTLARGVQVQPGDIVIYAGTNS
jgi:hypothetical protein